MILYKIVRNIKMDDYEGLIQINSDDLTNIPTFKDNIAVISSKNDKFYVHTDIFDLKYQDAVDDKDILSSDSHLNASSFVYDPTKITQKLDLDDIRKLKYQMLNPDIGITKEEIKNILDNSDTSSIDKNSQLITEDASYGLKVRWKGEKLSIDQAIFIKELSNDPEIKTIDIWKVYNVSKSVVNKIKRSTLFELNKARIKNWIKHFGTRKEKLIKSIQEFVSKNRSTFTAKEVASYVNFSLNADYSVKTIRIFMKTQLNLRFKRFKWRPTNINLKKIDHIRSLFAVKFLKDASTRKLTINIDESSLNREIKTRYSWGLKGKPIEAKNWSFSGSISWILAIWSNGSWIWLLCNSSVDSSKFIWFIKIMKRWLEDNNNFGYNQIDLLLDNCSFHKSIKTQKYLKKLLYNIYYIPAYSPEFAPIEMCFSLLKRDLSEKCKNDNVKLSFKHNFIKIHNSLMVLTTCKIQRIFQRFIKNLKEYLIL